MKIWGFENVHYLVFTFQKAKIGSRDKFNKCSCYGANIIPLTSSFGSWYSIGTWFTVQFRCSGTSFEERNTWGIGEPYLSFERVAIT